MQCNADTHYEDNSPWVFTIGNFTASMEEILSKTQQKKDQKFRAKLFRQLAKLYRRRAACNLFLAQLYEAKALKEKSNVR